MIAMTIAQKPFADVKTLLCVYAHPDDESFMSGGLLKLLSDAGKQVILLTLTKGEASRERARLGLTIPQMQALRAKELQNACRLLGITQIELHALPDKGLTENASYPVVKKAVQKYRPTDLLTFAPHGVTSHDDHQCASAVTTKVFAQSPFVRRLWYGTLPHSRIPKEEIFAGFAGDADCATFALDISAVAKQKKAAINAHKSQQYSRSRLQNPAMRATLTSEYYLLKTRQ